LGKGGSIDLRTEPVVITIRRSEPMRYDGPARAPIRLTQTKKSPAVRFARRAGLFLARERLYCG
jgi:hypothetical protein